MAQPKASKRRKTPTNQKRGLEYERLYRLPITDHLLWVMGRKNMEQLEPRIMQSCNTSLRGHTLTVRVSGERYRIHESDNFWHVWDTVTDKLIAHYQKPSGWAECAVESHCKRLNRENFDLLVATSGPGDPVEFLQKLWYDKDGYRKRT